jgi:hypothetical protein
VVGVTSAVGAITHARAGRVRWKVAAVFGAAAMAGAYAGGRLARFVPGTLPADRLRRDMIAAAVAMLRGRKDVADESAGPLPVAKIVLQGAAVGLISASSGPAADSCWCPRWRCSAGCRCRSPSAPPWSSSPCSPSPVSPGIWPANRSTGSWPRW